MLKSKFKKYMKIGLGRCYTFLSACENKEKYRKTVLYGCLHNLNFDEECEATRSEYIYRLCSLYPDEEYFLNPVLEKFESESAYDGDFTHLCDLVYAFAKRGNETALKALRDKYGELYAILLGPRDSDKYDYPRDYFERLAIYFTELGGLPEFLAAAKDIGNLYTVNENYCGWDFDGFYADFAESYGKEKLYKVLDEESQSSPQINKFFVSQQAEEARILEAERELREEREKSGFKPNKRESIAEKLSEKEILKLVKKLKAPFVNKYKLHGDVILTLLNAYDENLDIPKQAFELIYEKSPCSNCRNSAVEIMIERGWLTDEIKKECAYDSDEDTAKLVTTSQRKE